MPGRQKGDEHRPRRGTEGEKCWHWGGTWFYLDKKESVDRPPRGQTGLKLLKDFYHIKKVFFQFLKGLFLTEWL